MVIAHPCLLTPFQEEITVAPTAQDIGEGSAMSDLPRPPHRRQGMSAARPVLRPCFLAVWSQPQDDDLLLWQDRPGLHRWVGELQGADLETT